MDYDVIFVGSGHATWHGALKLRQAGKKVAMIEEDTIAGTCTNYGCDAKILLDGPFELTHQLSQYATIGVENHAKINWTDLMTYKHQIIDPLASQMTQLLTQMGIQLIKGHGELLDRHTVRVNGKQFTAKNLVLGTGQRPRTLSIPGQEYLHDSRDFLDIDEMPKRITFIGAGIISLEFASMAAELGSDVSIIEFADHALGNFHQPYVTQIINNLKDKGVTFHFNEAVSEVLKNSDSYQLRTKSGLQLTTDYILDATGRIPNVEKLGLKAAGIEFNNRGIVVDDHLRTKQPNVYASGDVLDKTIPKLTPTATFESNYVADQILGQTEAINYPAVPSVIYTLPRLASVGITPEVVSKQPADYIVQEIPYGKQMQFQTKNETDAKLTVVLDKTGLLVGATLIGNEASELINFLTLIIQKSMTADELNQSILAFPSTSTVIIELLTTIMQQVAVQAFQRK